MGFAGKSVALISFLALGFGLFIFAPLDVILYASDQISGRATRSNFYMSDDKCTLKFNTSVRKENPTAVPEFRCNCSTIPVITTPCQPASPAVVVEKETVAEEVAEQQQPWYAAGRLWHHPVKFPRCSMDVCFNYSRCDNMGRDFIFAYDVPSPPARYFSLLNTTKWYTTDAERACLFLVFLENRKRRSPHPRELPYWNGGMNHVLVTFSQRWSLGHVADHSIGFASLLITDLHETTCRPGFDISLSLNIRHRPLTQFQGLKPWERKYFLTFRGLQYLGHNGRGTLRSDESFRGMHNGRDVIVALSCRHKSNNRLRQKNPALGSHCDEDELIHANFSYIGLMNSTFGLAPAGRQAATYRFGEVLSAGAIPVLIADNYVKPFDTLIQWHKCILQFPSSEMRKIVPTLRNISNEEMEVRQEYCLKVYDAYFKDHQAMLNGAIDSLKARFMGVIPNLTPLTRL